MKTMFLLVAALVALGSLPAVAYIGDTYILPIHHRDGGGWVEYPGAGYGGTSAWGASGPDGVRRVYWELSGAPATTELYIIEAFAPTAGGTNWQPIESQFKGVNGETYPMEPLIPWAGAWGTNHQYIGSEGDLSGTWKATGPGPHTPESADYNAGANGIYMWLTNGSWLYAKWDFGWPINRSWSALRLTQVTGEYIPEPSSLMALVAGLAGLAGVAIRRRR